MMFSSRAESKLNSERIVSCERLNAFYMSIKMLKGHRQLCDCADLDTSFSRFEKSLPQPEIKVHQEICFIFRSVLLDFQSFTGKSVFQYPFAHPMILF